MLRGGGCDFFCNIFLVSRWCCFVLKVVSMRGVQSVGLSGGHWVVQRWGSGVGLQCSLKSFMWKCVLVEIVGKFAMWCDLLLIYVLNVE